MATRGARKAASQEQVFLEFVQQIDRHRAGRMALVVTLSPIETARGLQATQNLVCDQIKRHLAGRRYEMFRFNRGDVAVMTKDVPVGLLRDTAFGLIFRLKDESFFKLFADPESDLCRILDAEAEYGGLLSYAKAGLQGRVGLPGESLQTTAEDDESAAPRGEDTEVEIVTLSPEEVEIYRRDDGLDEPGERREDANVALESRREEIVRLPKGGDPEPIMTFICADREALIERFLFDADQETLDSYVPKILQQAEQQLLLRFARDSRAPEKLCAALQVETLLSAEFLTFDRARAESGAWPRAFLVLDRNAVRAGDVATFDFARDFVEGRGYELCLSGLGVHSLSKVRLKDQGFAYQFVEWDANEASMTTRGERAAMREGVAAPNAAITVMTGCSQDEAIEFGHKIGIEYFTGRAASAKLTHALYAAS